MSAAAEPEEEASLHASVVAMDGRGLLILGRPGAGKSALALELIALGATLVADDRALVTRRGAALVARAPVRLAGLIEARGMGLLRLPFAAETPLDLAVDLDATVGERLPPRRALALLGLSLPLFCRAAGNAAAATAAALRFGPPLDPDAWPDA